MYVHSEPTRVLWLSDTVSSNAGTERQIIELGKRLNTKRFNLYLTTFDDKVPADLKPVITEAFHIPLRRIWSASGVMQLWRLARFVRSRRIDIVHGFMAKSSLAAAAMGLMAKPRVVLGSRRNLSYYFTPALLFASRFLNRFLTRLVANSEAARQAAAAQDGMDLSRIDVLYNGVDLTEFTPLREGERPEPTAIPLPDGKRIVGIIANYRPVKDLGLFLRAASIIAPQAPDVVFLLVGSGPLQVELEALAQDLGIRDRVIFTEGQGAVQPYLHRMQIACLSSSSEGFSNAILEYMAAGLPVVATDVGGNREAIVEGETGFLVLERTPEAFAKPVLTLLQDPVLCARFARNGLERCRRKFNIEVAVRELEQYYDSLMGTVVPQVEETPEVSVS